MILVQEREKQPALKDVLEMIVQASHDTGACYGVAKCAETVFEGGKMVKVEGLEVLEERINAMDPDENAIFKFLGIEQVDGIKTRKCLNLSNLKLGKGFPC